MKKTIEPIETCFLYIKKIKILHPRTWKKNELLQLANDIGDGSDLNHWEMSKVGFTTDHKITTEWMET